MLRILNNLSETKAGTQRLRDRAFRGMTQRKRVAAKVTAEYAITGTPVDTGAARSSWEAGVNAKPSGNNPPLFPYPRLGRAGLTLITGRGAETANADAALAIASAQIDSAKLGDTIFLTNQVASEQDDEHYLTSLDQVPGYSLQPPTLRGLLFVFGAVQTGRAAAQEVPLYAD